MNIASRAFDNISETMAREEVPLNQMQRSILIMALNTWIDTAHGDGARSAMGSGRASVCICANMMSPGQNSIKSAWTCPRHGIMFVD